MTDQPKAEQAAAVKHYELRTRTDDAGNRPPPLPGYFCSGDLLMAKGMLRAALPAARAEWEEELLSDEVVEAVARIPWDNDFPGAWDQGIDPESEEDRDPRPQARSDVRSCLQAALDVALPPITSGAHPANRNPEIGGQPEPKTGSPQRQEQP